MGIRDQEAGGAVEIYFKGAVLLWLSGAFQLETPLQGASIKGSPDPLLTPTFLRPPRARKAASGITEV